MSEISLDSPGDLPVAYRSVIGSPGQPIASGHEVAKVESNAARTSTPAAFFVCPPLTEGPPPWWRGNTEAQASTERGSSQWHRGRASGSTTRRGTASLFRRGASTGWG